MSGAVCRGGRTTVVMAGLVPAIHAVERGACWQKRDGVGALRATFAARPRVDGRDAPGHDGALVRPVSWTRRRSHGTARRYRNLGFVMAGLVPAIHATERGARRQRRDGAGALRATSVARPRVDGRDAPGHDGALVRPVSWTRRRSHGTARQYRALRRVMAGPVPAIHATERGACWQKCDGAGALRATFAARLRVDGRDAPGHDGALVGPVRWTRRRPRGMARQYRALGFVMAGLVPAIHAVERGACWQKRDGVGALRATFAARLRVDGRDAPGHDGALVGPVRWTRRRPRGMARQYRALGFVMAGLVPAIHATERGARWRRCDGAGALRATSAARPGVDGRDRPGHDGCFFARHSGHSRRTRRPPPLA